MVKSVVGINGLGNSYRGQEKPALDEEDLEVAEEDSVVATGPSGVGSSTSCVSWNAWDFNSFARTILEHGTCTI
jgi:energy-coupling factor transporter ATP-binding protein EcfA2